MKAQVWTDGGGNTGHLCTCGAFMRLEGQRVPWEFARVLEDSNTNNEAEYEGVILGLKKAAEFSVDDVEVFSDSDLIVSQVSGKYKTENENLKPLLREVVVLIPNFDSFSISWVPRNENRNADALCREIKRSFKEDPSVTSLHRRKVYLPTPRPRPSSLRKKNPFSR